MLLGKAGTDGSRVGICPLERERPALVGLHGIDAAARPAVNHAEAVRPGCRAPACRQPRPAPYHPACRGRRGRTCNCPTFLRTCIRPPDFAIRHLGQLGRLYFDLRLAGNASSQDERGKCRKHHETDADMCTCFSMCVDSFLLFPSADIIPQSGAPRTRSAPPCQNKNRPESVSIQDLLFWRRGKSAALPKGGPSRGALRLLRSSRYALTQPDAFGAGASRDGHSQYSQEIKQSVACECGEWKVTF